MYVEQALADSWALEAQRFIGYWHGYGVRGLQFMNNVWADPDMPVWSEPLDETDDCQFCAITTEESVVRRIRGFQHEMDSEVLRLNPWVRKALYEEHIVIEAEDWDTLRTQLALAQERWPTEFSPAAYDFTSLPFYLKWRLCVRWNHLLRDWLADRPEYEYNFEKRLPVLKNTNETYEDIEAKSLLADDIAFAHGVAPEGMAGEIAAEYEEGVW
jgi:hypothetical protein